MGTSVSPYNEAVKWGGGVFAWESVVTIRGKSRVTRNTALLGGGIYLLAGAYTRPLFSST
jgi:hypothetical protein